MSQKADLVSLEILSNGTTHSRPTVIIRTTFDIYLFNCPEGTSRFLPSLRISPQGIKDFFITRGKWDCFGGLFGILLSKEASIKSVRLHGPPNLRSFLSYVRVFSGLSSSREQPFVLEERTYLDSKYEDATLTIHYLPMFIMNNDPSIKDCDIAYLVELQEPNKRIDVVKCMTKNVPKGPLIGELKAGRSIMLKDGTVVLPEEVYAEDVKDCCSNVLVVDCDDIEKLESLTANSYLQDYMNGKKQIGYIVHLGPESVTNESRYKKWMESFGQDCLNLMVNGSGDALPITEELYQQQRMLNDVCPDFFPRLFPINFTGNVTQEIEVSSTNVVKAKPLAKYPMRTTKMAKNNEAIGVFLEKPELDKRIEEDSSILDAINKFKDRVKAINATENEYPIVTFLGTGSAVPSKYRNVSAQLLQLNLNTSVLIDCGEGTHGQLKVLYGPDKIDDLLIGLPAIFITHAHLDHIAGMITIIERRREAFMIRGLEYNPLILVCNYIVRRMLVEYRTNFHDLDQYVKYIDVGHYVLNAEDFSEYSKDELICNFTSMLPNDLYSSEAWNLKSVKAMQVHHTRMSNGFVFDTGCGKRIVFSGDTMPCDLLAEAGKNADLLIHEATFEDGYEEDARRKKHSTSGQTMDVAQKMNAKYLILSHFSARYPRIPYISDLMLRVGNVGVAFDNMVVPFNRLQLLPLLLPVYAKLFTNELDALSLKEELSIIKNAFE